MQAEKTCSQVNLTILSSKMGSFDQTSAQILHVRKMASHLSRDKAAKTGLSD